jgi:hypothetical protein
MIPPRIDITFPRGSRVPTLRKSIDVHVFARETFDLRREVLAVGDKLSVGIYSAERTLIDIIRLFEELSGVKPPVRSQADTPKAQHIESSPACDRPMHSSSRKWDCRHGERPIIEIIPYV